MKLLDTWQKRSLAGLVVGAALYYGGKPLITKIAMNRGYGPKEADTIGTIGITAIYYGINRVLIKGKLPNALNFGYIMYNSPEIVEFTSNLLALEGALIQDKYPALAKFVESSSEVVKKGYEALKQVPKTARTLGALTAGCFYPVARFTLERPNTNPVERVFYELPRNYAIPSIAGQLVGWFCFNDYAKKGVELIPAFADKVSKWKPENIELFYHSLGMVAGGIGALVAARIGYLAIDTIFGTRQERELAKLQNPDNPDDQNARPSRINIRGAASGAVSGLRSLVKSLYKPIAIGLAAYNSGKLAEEVKLFDFRDVLEEKSYTTVGAFMWAYTASKLTSSIENVWGRLLAGATLTYLPITMALANIDFINIKSGPETLGLAAAVVGGLLSAANGPSPAPEQPVRPEPRADPQGTGTPQ